MKQLFILFFFISFAIKAQDYSAVDAKVKRYPKYNSVEKLAAKIKSDFNNDQDKVRAVFIWLTENIRYNLQEYYNPTNKRVRFKYSSETEKQAKLQQIKDEIVNETFKTRKSVCEGYAQSFKKACDLLNIEAVIIKGYARNSSNEIGIIPTSSNHAWNAVKLNNKWLLVDATWAAGYVIRNEWEKNFTEYYFCPNPKELLRSHLPESSNWQLIKNPVSKTWYANQPIIGQGFFNKNLELISPKEGIISKKASLNFKIKKLKQTDLISYIFKNQKYGKKANVTFNNGIASFTIDLQNKKNTELYIFINSEIALSYKIR